MRAMRDSKNIACHFRTNALRQAQAIVHHRSAMSAPESNVEFVRRYFNAIEAGVSAEDLALFFTPDVIQEDFPNRLLAQGARRGLPQILEALKRGKEIVQSQRFEIVHALHYGDEIAIEVRWTATFRVPIGKLPPGRPMRSTSAIFIRLVNGKIARQRNYDCIEEF
jgi:ketosteroid isomerase-like protein